MSGRPELSVVVLAYRSEEHAGDVVEPLVEELDASGTAYELVLVANYWPGRRDSTPHVVEELARDRPAIRTVVRPKEGGMGFDMRAGLAAARGDHLVVIDGDGQVPTRYALEIHRLLREGADVARGRRYLRQDGTARTLNSLAFNAIFALLFGTRRLWDVNGRPKGLTRSAYELLDLRTDDWFTDAEILLKARSLGLEIRDLPVVFLRNEKRGSFVGLDTVWEFLLNLARWRLGRHPVLADWRGRREASG